jgi:hypothetical protein
MLAALGVLGILVICREAWGDDAPPTAQSCIAQNEQAGPLRRAGKLREARTLLRQCSAPACPDLVRNDCIAAATQLDVSIPSVVFAAQDGSGADLTAVSVSMDGVKLAERLDGTALEVDPGEHLFQLDAAGQPPIEKKLVLIEGEKNRRERVTIGAPAPAPAPVPPPPPVAPTPPPDSGGGGGAQRTWGLVLGGIGIFGIGLGAVTGVMALGDWNQAKSDCGPPFPGACQNPTQASNDRSSTLTTGTVSTVAFVAGGAALVTGAVLFFTAPGAGAASHPVGLGVAPLGGGAQALIAGVLP